ncbi:MAG: AgmX/PglI C-terminal domain-containing protein, partial [Minicystis sp.]
LGRGAGSGTGQGFGSGSGGLGGVHRSSPPKLRIGASSVTGLLPPEVIQRIVRQNFVRFRLCYEKGLQVTPTLRGKVNVRYVIGKDGATSAVTSAGSDLPSKEVVNCVLKAFNTLSYPAPEGGVVVVVYPIMFEPGDDAAAPKPPAATPAAAPKAPPAPAPKAAPQPAPVDLAAP